jgi:hypothetical protein
MGTPVRTVHRGASYVVALLVDIPRTAPTADSVEWSDGGGGLGVPSGRVRPSPLVLRRRRTVAVALSLLALGGVWFGLQAALGPIGGSPLATADAPGGLQPAANRIWIVRPGDNLWSIAESVEPRSDVRPLVDRLATEVGSSDLYPGERVAIPPG